MKSPTNTWALLLTEAQSSKRCGPVWAPNCNILESKYFQENSFFWHFPPWRKIPPPPNFSLFVFITFFAEKYCCQTIQLPSLTDWLTSKLRLPIRQKNSPGNFCNKMNCFVLKEWRNSIQRFFAPGSVAELLELNRMDWFFLKMTVSCKKAWPFRNKLVLNGPEFHLELQNFSINLNWIWQLSLKN